MLQAKRIESSLVGDGELVDDVKVTDHNAELLEGNLAVEVGVGLNDGTIDELLQLSIVQVVTNHHLEYLEEFAIRDEAIIVDVIDLESETQLFLLTRTGGQRVQTLDELKEGDVTVIVAIKDGNDTAHKRVVGQLGNLKELRGLECAALISVDFAEVLVELLKFALGEVQVTELGLLLGQLISHFSSVLTRKINIKSIY